MLKGVANWASYFKCIWVFFIEKLAFVLFLYVSNDFVQYKNTVQYHTLHAT